MIVGAQPSNGRASNQNRFGMAFNNESGNAVGGKAIYSTGGGSGSGNNTGLFLNFAGNASGGPSQRYSSQHIPVPVGGSKPSSTKHSSSYRQSLNTRGSLNNNSSGMMNMTSTGGFGPKAPHPLGSKQHSAVIGSGPPQLDFTQKFDKNELQGLLVASQQPPQSSKNATQAPPRVGVVTGHGGPRKGLTPPQNLEE